MPELNDKEIVFAVDETSDLPIWVQLRNRIAYLIRVGKFSAGEQLPSVRSMAAEAKINYNTVTKAYRDLEQGGLIVNVRGRGMFVQKDVSNEHSEEAAADALAEECLRLYRAIGMSYQDAADRIATIADRLKSEAVQAMNEKKGFYDAK